HVAVLERDRAELPPPVDEAGLPRLQRPLEAPVAGQVHVVGDLGVAVDGGHGDAPPGLAMGVTPVPGRTTGGSRCRSGAAPPRGRRRSGAGKPSSATPTAGRRSWSPWSRGPRTAGWPPCPTGRRA